MRHRTRARLASFAVTVAVAAGVIASAAAASHAAGAHPGSEHNAGVPKQPRALSQLVLSPARSFIGAFGHEFYSAQTDGQDVTDSTEFSIVPASSGKDRGCDGNRCDVGKAGSYTVTGLRYRGEQTGTADLLVVPEGTSLALDPRHAKAEADEWVTYHAEGMSKEKQVDLTPYTVFSIWPDGRCDGTFCRAAKAGRHIVTGTAATTDRTLTGDENTALVAKAILDVVPGPLATLSLAPQSATIAAGESQTYHAGGFDAFGNPRDDQAVFSITPDGSCSNGGPTCTATKAGPHIVTAAVQLIGPTIARRSQTAITAEAILQVVPGPLAALSLAPQSATMTAGGSVTYRADGFDAFANSRGDYTANAAFDISPDGSCRGAGPTCTATTAGTHTVTAIAPTSDPALKQKGQTTITAEATLQVEPGPLASLHLTPRSATTAPGHGVTYKAHGADGFGNPRGDYTGQTAFSITGEGSCPKAGPTCAATTAGTHIVTGTVDLGHGDVTGTATLRVTPKTTGTSTHTPTPPTHTPTPTPPTHTPTPMSSSTAPPRPLTTLVLNPGSAVIKPGESVRYTAIGYGPDNNFLGDKTAGTRFSIRPLGSCAGATCTVPSAGTYTVTGTVDAGNRTVTGTASLRAATTTRNCVPPASHVRGLRVTPGKGIPGTFLHITATLGRKFAHCPLALFFGGTPLGGDLAVRPNGSVSERRTVPADAKPGHAEVVLAATDGRTVATTSFSVLPQPTPAAWWRREQMWPLSATAALLLAGAAAVSVSGQRARRQRRWVRQHVRVEARTSAGHLIAENDPRSPPTVALRLRPHPDAGATEITKGGDQ